MTQETKHKYVTCYIGIGSNLDSPLAHVKSAIRELQQLPNCKYQGTSSLYRTEPVGPAGQDDYINAVACLSTTLEPHALLDQLQHLENNHQRVRIERWGARTLDLDVLLIADQSINTQRLTVPHPYISERNFVLVPLLELAADIHINGQPITEMIKHCAAGGIEKIIP